MICDYFYIAENMAGQADSVSACNLGYVATWSILDSAVCIRSIRIEFSSHNFHFVFFLDSIGRNNCSKEVVVFIEACVVLFMIFVSTVLSCIYRICK